MCMSKEFEPASKERWIELGDAASYVESELEREGGAYAYVRLLDQLYEHQPLAKNAFNIGMGVLEPYDEQLGEDPEFPHGEAFYNGVLLGMRLVDYNMDIEQWESLQQHDSSAPETNSQAERAEVAEAIFRKGEQAYYRARSQVDDLIDVMAEGTIEDQYRPYMKVGVGFVLEQARQTLVVEHHIDMAVMRHEVMTAQRDWDEGLKRLLEDSIDDEGRA